MTLFTAIVLLAAGDWNSLCRQAEDLYVRGDLKAAIHTAHLSVDAAASPSESAHSLDRLGFFEYTAGDVKAAEADLLQALEIRRTKIGVETDDYAESANDTALLYRDSSRFPEARALAEQAVAIRTRILGPHDLRVAESLNTLGSTLALIGDYSEAIDRLEAARAIHEAQPEPHAPSEEYGTLCVNLAGTYQRVGKFANAETLFEKGLAVLRNNPGTNHPAYSASLVAYAYLQADLGHYSTAEKLYEECGKLLPQQLGEEHPVYAAFLNNRGALYASMGKLAVAEADYRKALELKRKTNPPDALTIGASLRNLARLVSLRNPAEGEKLFREAVDLYARNTKPPAFDYASALLGLAQVQRARGGLAEARATLQHASLVAEAGLGARHPMDAAILRELGLVHQAAHEDTDAAQCFKSAIAIVEEAQGDTHPDLARYLESLAAFYTQTRDFAAAAPLYRRSFELSDRALTDMLTVGSESDKRAAVTNLADPVPALISFQARAGAAVPGARALAFEAVARHKGRVLDVVHDWGRDLRRNPRFVQRQTLLECEASLGIALGYRDLKPPLVGTCSLPGTPFEGRYERLLHDLRTSWTDARAREALQAVKSLRAATDSMELELSRDLPQFASLVHPVRLDDIRAQLRPTERLLEFVAWSGRYGVFILNHAGSLQWIDLGPAAPIDRAVKNLIDAANDWSVSLAAHETAGAASAEQTARDALQTLSVELRPALAGASGRLRIAPDGMLNLVPFGALVDSRGHPLIERSAIGYVSAGRDLATASAASGAKPSEAVIAISPGAGSQRLEAAETEARDVEKWIPHAHVLGEGQATEQSIKQLHSPLLLHIVGHGIVHGNEDCRNDPASPGCKLAGLDPVARVMSLSAILLEEAYGRGGNSTQDGLLTALELQTLDLQGTRMLVLSQCRMADGVSSAGEGVYGMRRAAAIAGVRTFVAPLWRVADQTEQVLMDRFYQELSTGNDAAEALRQAQLQLLRNPRTAGFLHWSPIILSGYLGALPPSLFRK
ncbi:MAG TPA: CHAT domain-containing tetratricopeptide repeat protein [Candidatus Sulfopaludibacter sp.]|nr:CHAT domain-containing tetratricopeptide repeat protein [Candidatus Sulfopaludibacter sp.]